MLEPEIETDIQSVLAGNERKRALEFASYLRASNMQFERGKGYWENKLYWLVTYQREAVCFILLEGTEPKEELSPWTIWSDDSGSSWFEWAPLDEAMKETAWSCIDFCASCGSCGGGTSRIIFGKEFDAVCTIAFRFNSPDDKAAAFMRKMVELRKNDILDQQYKRSCKSIDANSPEALSKTE